MSVVVFVFVSWRFFYKRIPVEEYFLERMFGEEASGLDIDKRLKRGYRDSLRMGWCSLGSCNS